MSDDWSRPPPPEHGDKTNVKTFASVGLALSGWELVEAHLSLLFFYAVGGSTDAMRRAYGSVISFQGRRSMVKEAAVAFFLANPDEQLAKDFSQCLTVMDAASRRRNDIAHGIVQPYVRPGTDVIDGFALVPSYAATKHRKTDWSPEYFYTSTQIDAFAGRFDMLAGTTLQIVTRIMAKDRANGR